MPRKHLLFLLMACAPFLGLSQEKITGNTQDESGMAIPFANVALYSLPDSNLLGGTTSNENGEFVLEAQPGKFYLQISFLSFDDKIVPGITVENKPVKLGTVVLRESSMALEELVVTAERSQVEFKLDKRVYNVEKDLSNQGSNASEVLDNVPSVTVDVEGNVALRGSENVRILIDGKPSGLTGNGDASALRMLQGNMIESIEVITNPSSRYEAEGEVGIINIVLKKEKKAGANGAFELNAGHPHNYGASYNINYRRNKLNLFSSYGISYRRRPGKGSSIERYFSADTSFSYNQERTHNRGDFSNLFQIGSDYYITDNDRLTGSLLLKYSHGTNLSTITYEDINSSEEITATTTRDDEETEIEKEMEGSLSYFKQFEQKGRTWSIDGKWITNLDGESSDLVQRSGPALATESFQRSDNREDELSYLVQSDYVHPIGEKGKFEAGVRGSWRNINNEFLVEVRDTGDWFTLSGFNNQLEYQENIYAAYAMYGNEKGRVSYQLGIRGEFSDITTELLRTHERNRRQYFNPFPSAHFNYKFNEEKSVQLSYSRRLSRPRFRQLLPFFSLSDNRSYFSGNPNLDPEYTHSYEAGYLQYFSKGSILGSVYYRHRTGVIEYINQVDTSGLIRRFPVNLSEQDAFGLEMNLSLTITEWWRMNANLNAYRAMTHGNFEDQDLSSDTYTMTGRASTNLTIRQNINAQASFNYRGPQQTVQGMRLAMYSIDLGLSRDVFKGKGTVVFSVRDLLNSRMRRSIVDTPEYYSESSFQWVTRQFLVNFTYRLNQNKKRQGPQPAGGQEGGDFDM